MRILFVPRTGPGHGSGHLRRALSLCGEFGKRPGISCGILIRDPGLARRLEEDPDCAGIAFFNDWESAGDRDLVCLDYREADRTFFLKAASCGPVIGIDEGGPARAMIPYLIDTLPNLSSLPPNRTVLPVPGLEALSAEPVEFRFPIRKILVTFGGEDRGHLSEKILDALLHKLKLRAGDITVVQGRFFGTRTWPDGVKVSINPDGLSGLFKEHDLVITHFGLTAYEAAGYGLPVILFNPSPYHGVLAKKAGFPEIGVTRPRISRLEKLLSSKIPFTDFLSEFRAFLQAGDTVEQGTG